MNREVCKFFSGSFAALAYVHAAYAVATSRGIVDEPVFLGRRWGASDICGLRPVSTLRSAWRSGMPAGLLNLNCRNMNRQ
ncbi:hypothetical protein LAUMK142_00812 [Mycobacterium pseudokansasii]|uniref:Uncharacterized protein n=1 Tax=Mycobacterium pseudokansasii TaxID=2341080 RepID=A0A498QIM5_9MYCO|nr:hypothetical protein LAUMK142_00812 [Mycobacterium pseudokansasii]